MSCPCCHEYHRYPGTEIAIEKTEKKNQTERSIYTVTLGVRSCISDDVSTQQRRKQEKHKGQNNDQNYTEQTTERQTQSVRNGRESLVTTNFSMNCSCNVHVLSLCTGQRSEYIILNTLY